MAKTKTRYRTRVKRVYSKRKGLLTGNLGNIVWGAGAGFVSGMIPSNLPIVGNYAKPAVFGIAGWLLKKPALLSVAGYELGKSFTMSGNGTTFSGFWE